MRMGSGKFGIVVRTLSAQNRASEQELFVHLRELAAFQPAYITCTIWAPAASDRATRRWRSSERVHREFHTPVAFALDLRRATADDFAKPTWPKPGSAA